MEGKISIDFESHLSYEDLEILITNVVPNNRAKVVSSKLNNVCFINNKRLYVMQKNITFRYTESIESYLITFCTQLISESFANLPNESKELMSLKYNKKALKYSDMFKNSHVKSYKEQLISMLEIHGNMEKFDYTPREIHFNNGYIDLNDLTLKQRVKGQHFITKYINYEYVQSTDENKNKINKIIDMIYPVKEDRECILMLLGSALSGESCKNQDMIFLLGSGESGKSTMMSIMGIILQCYFQELKSDTFEKKNNEINKILNTYQNNKQIRFTWVNEMKCTMIDDSLFKNFCDGQITTTQLYKENCHSFQHYSKCFTTANVMPSIKIDSGSARRIISATHVSKFVDKTDVNEKEHRYLKDLSLKETIENDVGLKLALFDIVASYCQKWLSGQKIIYSKNFSETKDNIVSSNDIFQDFIDSKLITTEKPDDRIGKNKMHALFSKSYPDRHLSVLQIISNMKDHKIRYEGTYRSCDGIKGCFIGVKIKGTNDDDDEEDPYENGVEKLPKAVPMVLQSEFEKLQKENEELKKQIAEKQIHSELEIIENHVGMTVELEQMKALFSKLRTRTYDTIKEGLQLFAEYEDEHGRSLEEGETVFDELKLSFHS
jgi:phage/plasmid-associated DNA primase